MNRRSVVTRLFRGLVPALLPALLAAQQVAPPRPAPARPMTDAELANAKPGPDPRQAIDTAYTRKIKEYTTQPYFLSPIVDYLPASKSVPTPEAILGNIAGAPGKLPYSKEVYAYMRLLEKSTPRVKVVTIGVTEEGREMIAVAVASEQLIARLEQNKADLAKLADPRSIGMNDALADTIARRAAPVYYITGTIHSTEAGAPTALMELAYRLAVDDSPYIRNIREHVITLITPIVEVDGRDRVVDLYEYRKKHPDQIVPSLLYWGKYVGHDNNRDAMGLTLKLSQNVLDTYLGWKAQVLHDLHESVAFMYDNTIGDGPYNAWLDPILTNEWQLLGWNNVNEMTKWGMPGVFAFGTFDTWSPGYLMFMAATHNGISRLYETFGNGGSADTQDRTISANETTRTWYRQNPPLSRVRWSLRNNNNYEITGLLLSENYFATNRVYFLRNFYEKSKRSILKATTEGPAAYVFSANEVRSGTQAELLRLLQKQGVEISRATSSFTANLPVRAAAGGAAGGAPGAGRGGRGGGGNAAGQQPAAPPPSRDFPAGSYIVRMDQPYSRIADALLDYQYWAPNDPQKNPYDDTGWTFPEGFGVEAVRITDAAVLKVAMTQVKGEVTANRGVTGSGSVFLINHNADNALITLRYRLKTAEMQMAEEPFDASGQHFSRGSFIISGVSQSDLDRATTELGLKAWAVAATPLVKTHPARAARVAILHNWNSTQTEGWWRQAFDLYNIPYDYIDPGFVSKTPDLKAKYDVIVAGPGINQNTLDGTAMFANPVPWKNSSEMPNIGTYAQTDDIRPGFQLEGLLNLRNFVQQGGAMVAATSSAEFLITNNLARGATMTRAATTTRVVGSLLRSTVTDQGSPIMYGIPTNLAVFSDAGAFLGGGGGGGRGGGGGAAPAGAGGRGGAGAARPTGRGTPDDPDVVQGRPATMGTEPLGPPLPTDSLRPSNTMPAEMRPRPLLRFETQDKLLVSGLLDGGSDIAGQNVVVDIPSEKGHYILFANNPIYRGTTIGSYFMVFNAILSFDNLGVGRPAAAAGGAGGGGRGGRGGGGN